MCREGRPPRAGQLQSQSDGQASWTTSGYLFRWPRVLLFCASAMGLHQASHGLRVEGAGGLAMEYSQGSAEVDGFEGQLGVGLRPPGDAGERRSPMVDEGNFAPASGESNRVGMKLVGKFGKQEAWSQGERTSARVNNSTLEFDDHRWLSTSSTDTALCQDDQENNRNCYSCLQWSCEQGFYATSVPNCFHDSLYPDDDFLVEESGSIVRRCSDATCCEPEYTDVWDCDGYPSCPPGYDGLLVPCSLNGDSDFPLCDDQQCCGAPPSPTATAATWPPLVATPRPTVALVLTLTPTLHRTPPPISTLAPSPEIAEDLPTAEPTEGAPIWSNMEAPTSATPTPSVKGTPVVAPTAPPPAPTPTPSPPLVPMPTVASLPTLAPTPPETKLPTATSAPNVPRVPVATPTAPPPPGPTPAPSLHMAPTTVDLVLTLTPARPRTPLPIESPTPAATGRPVAAPPERLPPTSTPARVVAPTQLSPMSSPIGAPVTAQAPDITEDVTNSPSSALDEAEISGTETFGTNAAGAMSVLVVSGGVLLVASSLSGKASGAQTAPRIRSPAATLGLVTVTQLQSLAVLSLVDSIGSGNSSLSGFTDSLRWVNLWPSDSFAAGFVSTSNEKSRRLEEGDSTSSCVLSETDDGDIGMLVFIGNLVLVLGVLLGIFFLHVALVSAVEAYWLAKQRAKAEIAAAQRRGIPLCEFAARGHDGRKQQPQGITDLSVGSTPAGSQRAPDAPALTLNWLGRQELGEAKDRAFDDEREGDRPTTRRNQRLGQILECRNHSDSAWLHFPNIELLFLLFSFEGAVAAPIGALLEGGCSAVSAVAVVCLLVYPVLMFAMVCRTVFVRVRPDALIVFKTNDDGEEKSSFLTRVKAGVKDDHSLFAWADKGAWETVETADEEDRRHGDWFRIGFEPLFVDFTKTGAWFAVFVLAQAAAAACIGVLIEDSAVQLFSLCSLYTVAFVALIWANPFANSAVNAIGACLEAVNAVTSAMLGVIALGWEGTAAADRVDAAVMIIHIVALCALTIPVYIDSLLILLGAIRGNVQRAITRETEDGVSHAMKNKERDYIRRYVRRAWAGNWWTMFSTNVYAYARETSEGIREPRLRVSTSTPIELPAG